MTLVRPYKSTTLLQIDNLLTNGRTNLPTCFLVAQYIINREMYWRLYSNYFHLFYQILYLFGVIPNANIETFMHFLKYIVPSCAITTITIESRWSFKWIQNRQYRSLKCKKVSQMLIKAQESTKSSMNFCLYRLFWYFSNINNLRLLQ